MILSSGVSQKEGEEAYYGNPVASRLITALKTHTHTKKKRAMIILS